VGLQLDTVVAAAAGGGTVETAEGAGNRAVTFELLTLGDLQA
jgi:hypothetical protein